MRCRALLKDESSQKQNIIWFGSAGKNKRYTPQAFARYDQDRNPILVSDGVEKQWLSWRNRLYVAKNGISKNDSPEWTRYEDLYPNQLLFPSENLILGTRKVTYYRKVEATGEYELLEEKPDDWYDSYQDYYVIEFVLNQAESYDPTKIYYAHGNRIPCANYAEKQEGVRCSLIQRTSVLKGELWYKMSYGLPLTEKIKNKGIYDSIVISIIFSHPDVRSITSYASYVDKVSNVYSFTFSAMTAYNEEASVEYAM